MMKMMEIVKEWWQRWLIKASMKIDFKTRRFKIKQ